MNGVHLADAGRTRAWLRGTPSECWRGVVRLIDLGAVAITRGVALVFEHAAEREFARHRGGIPSLGYDGIPWAVRLAPGPRLYALLSWSSRIPGRGWIRGPLGDGGNPILGCASVPRVVLHRITIRGPSQATPALAGFWAGALV